MIDIFNKYGTILMTAMGQTLLLALYGLFFACIIGLIVGIMSVLKNKFCRGFALVFVNLIRGVPMIVLAYFIFFGIPFLCNSIMKIGGVTLTFSPWILARWKPPVLWDCLTGVPCSGLFSPRPFAP